jgi:hypothetical protein
MSPDLDLRGLDRVHEPDPAFVERLRLRLQAASSPAIDREDEVEYGEIPLHPRLDAARPSRRRIVFLAAAAVVVLAAASTLVWVQRDDSDRTFASGADAPFVGSWVSTDSDLSSQTMEIVAAGDAEYDVVAHDTAAEACAGAPSTMTGTGQGQPDRSLVIARPVFVCNDGSTPTVDGLTFAYEPATDELHDSAGVLWRRAGSDVTEPASAGEMWPQSSVDEVREAQARADAGDPAYTWQVDPQLAAQGWDAWHPYLSAGGVEIIERFLREELGWDHALFNFFESSTDADDGEIRNAVYLRCAPGETNAMYPRPPAEHQAAPPAEGCAPTIDDLRYETVSLDLDQLARHGADGIWVVRHWARLVPFAQTDPNIAEADATAHLEEFLGARIAGEGGAERYVDLRGGASWGTSLAGVDEIPLLYATTAGAHYERYEIERASGPWWPYGDMEFTVRLFADGGGTVVEQPMGWSYQDGSSGTLWLDATKTTENGQPVDVTYQFFDGAVTISAAAPWDLEVFPATALRLGDAESGIVLVDRPLPVATGCENGPAPADANALAASIQADPDFEATAPVAAMIGGTEALAMDVTVGPGASVCVGPPLVLGHDNDDEYGLEAPDGSRMRLYLVDLPGGSTTRIVAIAIVAPEAGFEDVKAAAAPVIESIEFNTE